MRRNVTISVIAALAGLGWLQSAARASHCGACAYPAGRCAPEQCCVPTCGSRVCYQDVVEERTCVRYRPVYHTEMRECRYTVCKTVQEQHVRECRYTVCKPVWEEYEVVRKFT